ncbi:MAG: TIGR03960 family B12-binding radical SAM protein [Anaerolineae bacterium]|nr:TIGR03960 family B12-binding radical SAM protein [Anaerolineae bacterium]
MSPAAKNAVTTTQPVNLRTASSHAIPWETIEALLHRVQKPGRYVGGEFNAIHKPWETADIHVCLAFPDIYDLGMSNFALAIFYDLLNAQPDILAERTYLPAPDMIAQMRGVGMPLYALESYRPVAAFDILAISAAYEQLYTNVLELLDLSGIPLRAADRDATHPLIVGGGHGTFNPEPVTDFFDVLVIGEAEEVLLDLVQTWRLHRRLPREAQLYALLDVPGLYIPCFYQSTGESGAVVPTDAAAPAHILKRLLPTLPPTPIRQLVPNVEVTHNRAVVEIQRGCTRGCRFCQAGSITRPVRERPATEIVDTIATILDATGYEEVALLSLSSADHSEIKPLLEAIMERFKDHHLSVSLPSLRIESFSVDLADMLSKGRRSGFTFAPEAGSDAMRRRINKDIATEDLLAVAEEVFTRGWRTLKLYFMLGLPGETDDDIEAIIDLAHRVRRLGLDIGGRKTEVHVSVSTFVPKPHTPFQWAPLADRATVERRQALLRERLRGRGLRLSWNAYDGTRLEALLARGDRRLNVVVEAAWRNGACFDAWDEWRSMEAWEHAFEETGIDVDEELYRPRAEDEPLPWDHLHSGVEKRFLLRDYRRSQAGELLSDCRGDCHACGILVNYPGMWTEEWECPGQGVGSKE